MLIAFPVNSVCTNAHQCYVIRVLPVVFLFISEQNEPHKLTDMLNVTADGTDVAAPERYTGQNLYGYVTTSVNSEIVTALPMKPDRESELSSSSCS